ncbi:MAG: ATP-binding protein, partial [Catalinimonas sp.]
EKIDKVFYNLLSNAVKFTPDGGVVDVDLALGDRATIRVRNTGPGIAPEALPHVFDRFYQADGHRHRAYEGTGIGLALVKELVELHHGTVEVESAAHGQTTFTVTLPVGRRHLTPDELDDERLSPPPMDLPVVVATPAATPTTDGGDAPAEATQVLIVDDHAELRRYIRENLPAGCHVLEAENGRVALALAVEHVPDLIVSDVMMPEMDGLALLRALRQNEKTNHVPVILLTARAAVEDKLSGLQSGADDYLVKPFVPDELRARVHNVVQMRRQWREKFGQQFRLHPTAVSVPSQQEHFVNKLRHTIETRMADETFGVEELGREMGMSRTQLNRKLRALLDQTPSELIRSFRLERAAALIRQNAGNMAEIAYQVGFNSQSYFTRAFQNTYRCTPLAYKRQHAAQESEVE